MQSEKGLRQADRRSERRLPGRDFRLLAPADAHIVDCGRRGMGIETSESLAVGRLTSVKIFLPASELVLLGKVSWARLVANRRGADGDSAPVYRAGIELVEGQSFNLWTRLLTRLISPTAEGAASRPRRRVVRWRRPWNPPETTN